MPKVGETLDRIRRLVNDQQDYPDGSPKPDYKFSDRDIAVELGRSLLELLHKKPSAYYPNSMTAAEMIAGVTTLADTNASTAERDKDIDLDASFMPGVEAGVVASLETTDQEGVRSETAQQLVEVTRGQA